MLQLTVLSLQKLWGSLQRSGMGRPGLCERLQGSANSPGALSLHGLGCLLRPLPGLASVLGCTSVGALLRAALSLSVLWGTFLEAPSSVLCGTLVLCCAVRDSAPWLLGVRQNVPCISYPHTDTQGSLLLPWRLPGFHAVGWWPARCLADALRCPSAESAVTVLRRGAQ